MNEKLRVLKLLEEGKITSEEAIRMLELLNMPEDGTASEEGDIHEDAEEGETGERASDRWDERSGEKGKSFVLSVDVQSLDIYVEQSAEAEEIQYEFVDPATGECVDTPEYVDVIWDQNRLKISESFYKNIGPKMASGSIGKKMIEMIGLTASPRPIYTVAIRIPANRKISEARFSTSSTSIDAIGLGTAEKIRMNTASGAISIRDVICDRLSMNTVSGRTTADHILSNVVKYNGISGSFEFDGKTPEMNVNSVSGAVYLVNDMHLYQSSINNVSGSTHCLIRDIAGQNYSVSGMFKQQKQKARVNGEPGTMLTVSTVSGPVQISDLSSVR